MLELLINSLRFDRPWWLYESAPYLYLAVGLLVMAHLNGPLAGLSAALLILAGLHVSPGAAGGLRQGTGTGAAAPR